MYIQWTTITWMIETSTNVARVASESRGIVTRSICYIITMATKMFVVCERSLVLTIIDNYNISLLSVFGITLN